MTQRNEPHAELTEEMMQPELLISVVIPVFNRPIVLRRALESVRAQAIEDMEVIVVDDGSSDPSEVIKVCGDFAGVGLRVERHQTNRGGAAARNTGIREAKGRYIAFLDSDDEWLPGKLTQQLEVACLQEDDNWLCYCQSIVKTSDLSDEGDVWPQRCLQADESVGDYLFASRGFMQTSSFFLPKSLAAKMPFNENLRRHQDYDFLLRLEAGGCRFLMVSKPLVVVHWEDLHPMERGFSAQRSLDFLEEYRHFLSPRARSGFVMQQIVIRALRAGRRLHALSHFTLHVRLRDLTLVDWLNTASMLVFRDSRIPRWLARIKRSW
jgi:glycosyltransferase involved in cell wall biosynthesis